VRLDTLKRCWVQKEIRPIIGAQIIRECTYAFELIYPFDGRSVFLILSSMDSKHLTIFLGEVSIQHKEGGILMLIGRSVCHKLQILDLPKKLVSESFLHILLNSIQEKIMEWCARKILQKYGI
jgi:hypothetical protein